MIPMILVSRYSTPLPIGYPDHEHQLNGDLHSPHIVHWDICLACGLALFPVTLSGTVPAPMQIVPGQTDAIRTAMGSAEAGVCERSRYANWWFVAQKDRDFYVRGDDLRRMKLRIYRKQCV